jgi:hypothetical protein
MYGDLFETNTCSIAPTCSLFCSLAAEATSGVCTVEALLCRTAVFVKLGQLGPATWHAQRAVWHAQQALAGACSCVLEYQDLLSNLALAYHSLAVCFGPGTTSNNEHEKGARESKDEEGKFQNIGEEDKRLSSRRHSTTEQRLRRDWALAFHRKASEVASQFDVGRGLPKLQLAAACQRACERALGD